MNKIFIMLFSICIVLQLGLWHRQTDFEENIGRELDVLKKEIMFQKLVMTMFNIEKTLLL